MHGFVIAGTHSGCGKTTVTLGLLAALKKKGMKAQPFKAGPDFIDSGLHRLASGSTSRNLDVRMCGAEYVQECFRRHAMSADAAVVEGVMGMFDGEPGTAGLAALLGLPVILVVDAYGMAESAGAVVKGFVEYQCSSTAAQQSGGKTGKNYCSTALLSCCAIAGVIFNRVASEGHYERLRKSVREVPVLGYLPRSATFEIPQRHLGLATVEEEPLGGNGLEDLAETVIEFIDMDRLLNITRKDLAVAEQNASAAPRKMRSGIRIGVARDRAFCFYYEDNLDMLAEAGAELVFFSPLEDHALPEGIDGLYMGGGYPELYARRLSANKSMLSSVRGWCDSGGPVYAECGGMMYLSRGIHDFKGAFWGMADVLPFATAMEKGRSGLGYREAELMEDCILGRKGSFARGHEFHYSEIQGSKDGVEKVYRVSGAVDEEGYRVGNILASYIHVHFGSNTDIAENFVRFVKEKKA